MSKRKGDGHDENLPVVVTETRMEASGEAASETAEATPPAAAEVRAVEAAEPAVPEPEIETLRRERDELRDALLRRRADFENYRKRVERERQVADTEVEAALFRQLLGTLDNLERALAAKGPEDALRHGVELTRHELLTLLESHGVVAIDALGKVFDPRLHQALLHEAVPGLAEGTVAEVYRKGYTFGDRLLRPALVKVAKAQTESGGGEDGGDVH